MSTIDRVCVVTGAAAGLGRSMADRFAADGCRVVLVDRDTERLAVSVSEITETGGRADGRVVDISREEQVEDLAAWLAADPGRVDVLVNNAGLALREGDVVDMTRKAWDLTMAVNLTGTFLMSRHLVPLMPPGSSIVNVATNAVHRAVPGTDAYVAAKAGVAGLTKAMAVSLADRGIRGQRRLAGRDRQRGGNGPPRRPSGAGHDRPGPATRRLRPPRGAGGSGQLPVPGRGPVRERRDPPGRRRSHHVTLTPGDVSVVGDITAANARRHPGREAVVDGDRRLTWRELEGRVVRLANALTAGLGLVVGDRVSILADNCLEYVEYFHATATAGLIAAPLNQRLAPSELAQIVELVEPRLILCSAGYEDQAVELARIASAEVVAIGATAGRSYEALLAGGRPTRADYRVTPDDVATICFTGGTTGLPKGVMIPHRSLAACGPRTMIYQGLTGFDRQLFVRPMAVAPGHRMTGQHGYSTATTIVVPRFEPEIFRRLTEQEQATTSLLTPTMFQMFLESGVRGEDLQSMRSFAYGGAPSTPDLIGRVMEAFPAVDLHHVYGGTEAAVALHLGPDEHRAGLLDSVGREIPGVSVGFVDEVGTSVPDGEPGELTVRSDELFIGYWGDPEGTAEVLRDGCFWSGDIGVRDDSGFVRLVGRRKDVVISGGYNVYPIEVENVLADHPGVSEVAVIGLPHDRWGESVHAVVVAVAGAAVSEADLIEFCTGRIASYKKPKTVELVDALPRTSVGKIAKNVLREERLGSST